MNEGLSYLTMLRLLEDNKATTPEQKCSLSREVHNWFSAAKQIADKNKQLRKYHEKMIVDVYHNTYRFGYEALHQTILMLLKKHEDEVTKGHLGTAIGYMLNAKNFIYSMKHHEPNMKKEDKNRIEEVYKKEIKQLLADSLEKNEKVNIFFFQKKQIL